MSRCCFVSAGPSDAPATAGAKPADVPVPRNPPRPLPKAPPSQSAAGAPDSSSPSTPAKGPLFSSFFLVSNMFNVEIWFVVWIFSFRIVANLGFNA